jgi:putative hydrolase of the HAD superfamily
MIRAVFFDFDGTIRQNLPSGGEFFADHAERLGLRIRADDRLRAMRWEHLYWANSRDLLEDRQRYDGQIGEFWMRYSQRQLVALGASALQAADLSAPMNEYMAESYKPESVVPADVREALPALVAAGYKLAVISNRGKPYQEELEGMGLAPFFAFSLAGGEINSFKPEPEIFLQACARVDVAPAEAAYVGDNYFADVVGARAAGLMPVLYDPREIFPDPGCAIIRSFAELPRLLGNGQSTAH